ncbi:hypothetical protein BOX15_Mlig025502g2 [Macrostomum lignano]|uniref:Obg-like ATPase 1 n=1 Tax=Macrostomum lignano TaxID=282301 RepID=A0A267F5L6_9PLAT|nr:hypothetical protein BOX15_Mlig025502g2 [Macrostomum lignano]
MPPKKKGADEPKNPPIIGRMGSNLKIGIVGLPNVGKSTFFNVLTKSSAPAENFPFCTIDPHESRVAVPDDRWEWLCEHWKPASRVPAYLNVWDIAGLVKGASEGQGLGNAFLSNIRGVDALFHMVRAFDCQEVTHIEGEVDPIRDLEIISEELRLKDEAYIVKEFEKLEKVVTRGGDKSKTALFEAFQKVHRIVVEEKRSLRFEQWNDKEIDLLNEHLFITAKPIVYLVNLSEKDFIRKKNKWLPKIKEWIDQHDPGAAVIPLSAELEFKWADMTDEQRAEFSKEHGVSSALGKIISTGYKALQLQYFFTAGKDEVKAWTIPLNTKAPQAAGKIHSDMENGFIMAEVMSFEDYKECGSESEVKAKGKYKQKGREYVVQDGDIIFFKFNAGAGLTAKKK